MVEIIKGTGELPNHIELSVCRISACLTQPAVVLKDTYRVLIAMPVIEVDLNEAAKKRAHCTLLGLSHTLQL
jgi:hypothetical protein